MRAPRIFFDHQCFWECYGGVSKYFIELMKQMPESSIITPKIFTNNEYIGEISWIDAHHFLKNYAFRGKALMTKEFGKIFTLSKMLQGGFDIYHPTHYDCFGLNLIPKRVKTVATIHDMNFFTIPEYYGCLTHNRDAVNQRKMANRVDHIITVSNQSKKDIMDMWGIPSNRISVIYHGCNKKKIEELPKGKINNEYILFVGRRSAYKNFKGALKAFAIISDRFPGLEFYCAGTPFNRDEMAEIRKLGLINKCKSISASESTLYNLYRNAIAFCFPSFYEGFGIPILEAMACQCPVVLSNTSCFPEIASDAGLYFNPREPEDIAEKLEKTLTDSDLRKSLVAKGNERIQEFTWERSATRHMTVYKSLL